MFCISGMIGILKGNLIFWIIFTILHLLTCIYLSLQIYYMGCWKLNYIIPTTSFCNFFSNFRTGFLNIFTPAYKGNFL